MSCKAGVAEASSGKKDASYYTHARFSSVQSAPRGDGWQAATAGVATSYTGVVIAGT